MNKIEEQIRADLFSMRDDGYKNFQCSLMPGISPDVVIGVRIPILRKYASSFAQREEAKVFLKLLPHKYYEENNLHGFLIEKLRNFDEIIEALDAFLPYVDNWSTCDGISPKVFKENKKALLSVIDIWLSSDKTYVVRYAIRMLMCHFLGKDFLPEYADRVAALRSDEYYIKMMVAWYFATALAKNYDEVLPYIESRTLDTWTHNKAIQKSVESYRLTDEKKLYLKTLKYK
ncbi:MAG: DNA alkylation repair protein [Clostridia bacterium]|nr:DNA alkylation repair protein [Clostridia bacterium]